MAGYIGIRRVPTTASASGVWRLNEQAKARKDGIWPIDPYWQRVSLLLRFDGVSGSQTFTDSSNNAFSVTANGHANLSNSVAKFGTTSGLFDGDGDYLTVAENTAFNFGSDDFTVELFYYCSSTTRFASLLSLYESGRAGWALQSQRNLSDNKPAFVLSTSGSICDIEIVSGTNATMDTWNHLAAVRVGSTINLYLNGNNVGSGSVSGSIFMPSGVGVSVGGFWTGNPSFTGYIDALRLTKGAARYTGNFTVPTVSF